MPDRGWVVDPTGRHEARYVSDGRPTALVRDGSGEGHDPVGAGDLVPEGAVPARLHDDDADSPRLVARGERFERRNGGSLADHQPPDPRADENWVDRLILPVVSPLRPSRFGDQRYWRVYVPTVIVFWVVVLAIGALLAWIL